MSLYFLIKFYTRFVWIFDRMFNVRCMLPLELHYTRLLSERSDFHSVVIFAMAVSLRRFTCSYTIFLRSSGLYCRSLRCFEADYIGFVWLNYNASPRSASGAIIASPPEQSDFHSTNRSVVYRIGAAWCNQTSFRYESHSAPIAIRYTVIGAYTWCHFNFIQLL